MFFDSSSACFTIPTRAPRLLGVEPPRLASKGAKGPLSSINHSAHSFPHRFRYSFASPRLSLLRHSVIFRTVLASSMRHQGGRDQVLLPSLSLCWRFRCVAPPVYDSRYPEYTPSPSPSPSRTLCISVHPHLLTLLLSLAHRLFNPHWTSSLNLNTATTHLWNNLSQPFCSLTNCPSSLPTALSQNFHTSNHCQLNENEVSFLVAHVGPGMQIASRLSGGVEVWLVRSAIKRIDQS